VREKKPDCGVVVYEITGEEASRENADEYQALEYQALAHGRPAPARACGKSHRRDRLRAEFLGARRASACDFT